MCEVKVLIGDIILNQFIRYLLNECIIGKYTFNGVWVCNYKNNEVIYIYKCIDCVNNIYKDIFKLVKSDTTDIFDINCKFTGWQEYNGSENFIVNDPKISMSDTHKSKYLNDIDFNSCFLIFKFTKNEDDNSIPEIFNIEKRLKNLEKKHILENGGNLEMGQTINTDCEIDKDFEIELNSSIKIDELNNEIMRLKLENSKLENKLLHQKLKAENCEKNLLKEKIKNTRLEKKLLDDTIIVCDSIPAESYSSVGEFLNNETVPVATSLDT